MICIRCKIDKPETEYRTRHDTGKLKRYCVDCSNDLSNESRARLSEGGTKKYCRTCKRWLETTLFQQYSSGKLYNSCKQCTIMNVKNGVGKPMTVVVGERKLCLRCKELIPLTNFAKASRGISGCGPYCNECRKDYHSNHYSKKTDTYRENSYRWRTDNRERYLAQHRIHQFNRKSAVKATDDGTITPEFLAELYATTTCFYCNRETPPELRTLEHITPLSRGGLHSTSNVTMACRSCNSSKRHLLKEEWKND